jgi:hypothetical protein
MQAEDLNQLEFIDFLRSRCKSVEVYIAKKFDAPESEDEFESFPLILIETENGEWIGVAPEVDADFNARLRENISPFDSDLKKEQEFWKYARNKAEAIPSEILDTISLKAKSDFYVRFDLESLIKNSDIFVPDSILKRKHFGDRVPQFYTRLDWSYNLQKKLLESSDYNSFLQIEVLKRQQVNKATYLLATEIKEKLLGMKLFTRQYGKPHEPVENFVMSASANKEFVLNSLLEAVGFVNTFAFQEFSKEAENYEGYPDEMEDYTRLKPIDEFLVNNLSNLREYVVGCMSVFYLYDVGQTSDGDWIGVRTVAIWT